MDLTGSDDLPTETIAFFTATISPKVYHTAVTHSLKTNWVVNSGANVHICNQRDRFISLTKDESVEITMGNGSAIAQSRGTARIIVRNPTSDQIQRAALKDVWYAPGFANNIISVSEIKKNCFFFTSELPRIVTSSDPAAVCEEMYGLYLLMQGCGPRPSLMKIQPNLISKQAALASVKMSEKPLVSTVTAEIWHRRLSHLYPRRVETWRRW